VEAVKEGSMLAMALFAACVNDKEDDTEGPPLSGDDTAVETCDGTAPEVSELEIGPYGQLYSFEDGDNPAMVVSTTATDADGDLNRMDVVLWWDDVVDGTVDTSGAGEEGGYYQMKDTTCGTFTATYNLLMEVNGGRFAYSTPYEFAAQAIDDAGLVSEVIVVADGISPDESGN
jgi:hypothetical protein